MSNQSPDSDNGPYIGPEDANRGKCTWSGCRCTDYSPPATAGGHCQHDYCKHGASWHEFK